MLFVKEVTVPANTTEADPYEIEIKLTKGLIVDGRCFFPDNSAGQLHVTISEGLHQVWPTNPDGNMRGNNQDVLFETRHEVEDPPYTYTVKGWNTDDTFEHGCILRFVMERVPEVGEEENLVTWLRRIAQRVGWKAKATVMVPVMGVRRGP